MVHVLPSWAEARVIGVPTGVGGMIGLASWADANPTRHLWDQGWFQAAMVLLGILAILGFYGFIAHWKIRSIPPVLIAAVAVAVFFRLPTIAVLGLITAAFLGTAYLVSPDRGVAQPAKVAQPTVDGENVNKLKQTIDAQRDEVYQANAARDEIRRERDALKDKCDRVSGELEIVQSTAQSQQRALLQELDVRMSKADGQTLLGELVEARAARDAALADKAAIVKSLPPPPREALLRGVVERFAAVSADIITHRQTVDLQRQLNRPLTSRDIIASDTVGYAQNWSWYAAWLQVEAITLPSKASSWSASMKHKDEDEVGCELLLQDWDQPDDWPQSVTFITLPKVQSMMLSPGQVYNVNLYIRCRESESILNMKSFAVRFSDDDGNEVTCSIRKPHKSGVQ